MSVLVSNTLANCEKFREPGALADTRTEITYYDLARHSSQDRHGLLISDYYGLAEAEPVTYEPEGAFVFGADVGDGTHEVCSAICCKDELNTLDIRRLQNRRIEVTGFRAGFSEWKRYPRTGLANRMPPKSETCLKRSIGDGGKCTRSS